MLVGSQRRPANLLVEDTILGAVEITSYEPFCYQLSSIVLNLAISLFMWCLELGLSSSQVASSDKM